MAFKKLKPVPKDKVHIGCLHCSTVQYPKASMRTKIWGEIETITCDGEEIFTTKFDDENYAKSPTLMTFENMARKKPDSDWRYIHMTALHDEEYQRQGKNNWVMVKSGKGYA